MELKAKRVMVIGLGVTGRAVARFAAARGARLLMTDRRADVADLESLPVGEVHLGVEDPTWLNGIDLVVTSPGVPPTSLLIRAATQREIPVTGELELASRFIHAPIAAVTGTNGKSTVTVLLGEILKAAGLAAFVGGNLGTPLIEAVGGDYQALVVEVSSYQLEWIVRFRPRVGIHLNLAEDHLDRYRDIEEYGRAKARLFVNQDATDFAILNRDDERVWSLAAGLRARVVAFGQAQSRERPALWLEGRRIHFDDGVNRDRIDLGGFALPGRHNLMNAMAAAGAALAMGVKAGAIEHALSTFKGLAHRLEVVHHLRGVTFVDDSKGTNVAAVAEALAAFAGPIILLAGGVDKGGDYAPLMEPIREKVKLLIVYGAARERIREALLGTARTEVVETLSQAVAAAALHARRGDTVMLSPACSSFDQFRNYAERGNTFQKLVRAL